MIRVRAIGYFKAALVFALPIAVLAPVMGRIVLNGTPSVKASIFWKTPDQAIEKGDFVMAPARHPYIPPNYPYLTKIAMCFPGDRLKFEAGRFSCNGVPLNQTKKETLTGAPLEPFQWNDAVIPPGKVFIGSPHPDGFDSRYLGFFAIEELTRLEALI
ncbi:MAG: S26 family signal peptidase [Pseudomonadota bacterium]